MNKELFECKLEEKQKEIDNYISSIEKIAVIFKFKRDGIITYMNEIMLEVSGYIKEDLEKVSFYDLIHPDIPKKYIDETWNELEEGKLWSGNTKFISKTKETFYLKTTIFKNLDSIDEYTTVAFLTTKENLEKRDFHKKVLLSIKEFNTKERKYKEEIKNLRDQIALINITDFENKIRILKQKNHSYESQLKKYETDIDTLNKKYLDMLETKKTETSHYVDLLHAEKKKNDKLKEENMKLSEECKILKELNESLEEKQIRK